MGQELLDGLNAEQLKAVTSTEGPLLIVAGAGTGKTRVVTRRIAYLLESRPDLKPENILALTYTNKAADEMRERVEALTGQNTEGMFIGTIHAFCNQLLDEAGSHIGLPRLRQIDEIEQWIFLEDHLEKLGLSYYMTLANPRDVIKDFVRFVSRCKDGMVGPQDYAEYAQGLRDSFESEKDALDEEERAARELEVTREEELARVYRIYQEELLKAGLRDFGDSIIYTIRLLKERPNVLQSYQEQYKYILVDEFQDTNLAQIEIISLLAARHRNICACGDSDQAIYRFRGASFASFNHFMERFPEADKIRLSTNYRSGAHILSAAGRLIGNNGADRFEPAVLTPSDGGGHVVSILICPDYTDEARAVAEEISQIYRSLPEEERRYSDIAVLYRAHSHKNEVIKALKSRGIPFQVSGVGLFDRPEIRDLLALLTVVDDFRDSIACVRVLSSRLFDVRPKDVMQISHFARRAEITLCEAIGRTGEIDGLLSETRQKLAVFSNILAELEEKAVGSTALEFTLAMLKETGYIKLLMSDPSFDQAARNIGAFCRFIEGYVDGAIDPSLHGFMRYFERYREAGGNPDAPGAGDDEDAVRLMTVHGAKGLEFPYVFVIGLTSQRFPTRNRKEAIPFPDALNKDFLPGADFHTQEERRLCYVAMTRAQEKLYLCAVKKRGTPPSPFIKEVDVHGHLAGTARAEENGDADYAVRVIEGAGGEGGALAYPGVLGGLGAEYTRDIVRQLHRIPSVFRSDEALEGIVEQVLERTWSLIRLTRLSNVEDADYYEEALAELDSLWPRIAGALLTEDPVFISEIARKKLIRHLRDAAGVRPAVSRPSTARDRRSLTLSFTQIDCYLRCPRQYYYAYILGIPRKPVAVPSFGTVMHGVLAELYRRIRKGEVPALAEVIALYEASWKSTGFESKLQEEEYKKTGYAQLTRFYELNAPTMRPAFALEHSFKLKVGDHIVSGRIDRIDELEDGTVEIIDYKTGKAKDKRHADKDLQLGIYALAALRELDRVPSGLSFYYLSTNEKVTSTRTDEQLRSVEQTIIECAARIQDGEFDPDPNISGHCKWCDFTLLCDAMEK